MPHFKVVFLLLMLCAICSSCGSFTAKKDKSTPKNIILLIGDGMGATYLSAYRYYKNKTFATSPLVPTSFDRYWVGISSTYPDDKTWVSDSSAAATALSSGHKTYNGAVGINSKKEVLPLMFHYAKQAGKTTGIIATSSLTHATPASFYAHQESRKQHNKIANWLIDNNVNGKPLVDIALGGGKKYFVREDRNIIKELKNKGYQYIDSFEQLNRLTKIPALGLLANKHLPSALDSSKTRLHTMLHTALRLLKNSDKGFVLVAEGSQIDWCGHATDIVCAMAEMTDFENAFNTAIEFAKQDGNTLVLVTADHETGGLSLGADGEYSWEGSLIHHATLSTQALALKLRQSASPFSVWQQYYGFNLSDKEKKKLETALKKSRKKSESTIKEIVNKRTFTGWTGGGHTAQDVPVLAFGPGSDIFSGFQDNTDIAKKIIGFIEEKRR